MSLNIRAKTNHLLFQLNSFTQSILRKNWFHKGVWVDVGTKRYLYLDNADIKQLRIYQTVDAFICLKFFSQHFLPYKSWKWWKLWINNETYLDGFGNFKQREQPMDAQLEITTDDTGRVWIDPLSWYKKRRKKKTYNKDDIKYNTGVDEKQSIKVEKKRLAWSLAIAHGWEKAKGCFYCSKPLTRSQKTKEHILPRSRANGFEYNIVACCRKCNGRKGGMTPSEWRVAILKTNSHQIAMNGYLPILKTLDKFILE